MTAPLLLGRLLLRADCKASEVHEDLSAAIFTPDGSLWVASDEHRSLERFSPLDGRVLGNHRRYCVPELLGERPQDEIDIEALDYQDGHLWLVGSHSAKRKKPKGRDMAEDVARLARVVHEPSRFLLARVPLPEGGDSKGCKEEQGEAERVQGAARVGRSQEAQASEGVNLLVDLLREDEHLKPFLAPASPEEPQGPLAIPSKDNGLDIEGLAVSGERVFLGLRGPVLRGFAVLLQLPEVEEVRPGRLEARQKKGRRYHKHFLDLDGLGIRELCRHGDDLLILAGPTLPTEGPIRLYRLRDGLKLRGDTLHRQQPGVLEPLFEIPRAPQEDQAEGLALYSWFEENDSVLVVYDTPGAYRRHGPTGVLADVFRL